MILVRPKLSRGMLCSRLLPLIVSVTAFALPIQAAQAQRGLTPQKQEQNSNAPSAGVAGFFDTQTAGENDLVGDLPTFAIDYGLTPNVTIGTNGLALLTLAVGATQASKTPFPPLYGKVRYRVFAQDNWSGAVTGYLFGMKTNNQSPLSADSQSQTVIYSGATLNLAQDFETSGWGMSFFAARLASSSGATQAIRDNKSERVLQLASAWWRKTLVQTLESEILLLTCPLYESSDTSPLARIDSKQACFGDRITDPALRGLLNWRSTEQWLWTAGVIWLPRSENKVFPVLGITHILSFGSARSEE